MNASVQKETLEFQTEAKQLLHLMIHSLYSNKEIFLRELVSNASDACDKLRFDALSASALWEGDTELRIEIGFDKEQRTISIRDNGIGMSREDVIKNIGTIARSGTREFFDRLSGDEKKNTQLIGQFGVGFYSAFLVAERVEVISRRAGDPAEQGVRWESHGEGTYSIETIHRELRGTEVILHLRAEEDELLSDYRLKHIVKKYSDHISLPIFLLNAGADSATPPSPEATDKLTCEREQINAAMALWTRPKKDITAEEYQEFYKTVSLDYNAPLSFLHSHVEGTQAYTLLLYIPKRASYDLWDRTRRQGVKLYVKRIFIMDDAEHLMPNYLRFIRGVVDSDDLPLNVSRELLQSNPTIDKIRSTAVKKMLGLLEQLASDETEKYAEFWQAFGRVLKEGPAEDFTNRERIATLLRFSSTLKSSETADVSLKEYVARMKSGQKSIYYVTSDNFRAACHSPHLEIFKKHDIEVLLMHDRVDEWLMNHLTEFDGKPFRSVAKGDLDLDGVVQIPVNDKKPEEEGQYQELLKSMASTLGKRVKEVRLSHRLTDSPACLVVEQDQMAMSLQHLLKQSGHEMPGVQPILEINPDHLFIKNLKTETDPEQLSRWTQLIFDQALLSEGGQLEDPAEYVARLNQLLVAYLLNR